MPIQVPVREPADPKFTVRQSDWSGGYNRIYYQIPGEPTEPRFWDAFNIESGKEGEIELAPLFERVQSDASDKKPLLTEFNGAIYRLEGVTTPAVQKSTDGTTWTSVGMTSGPTLAIRGSTVWRKELYVAANSNTIFKLSTGDVWSSVAAPAGVTQVCDMVGVTPDDKLFAWFNTKGLYGWDGSAWSAKLWPLNNDPDEPTCDVLDGSTGATLVATSDDKGSSFHEYFSAEGAATAASMVTWLQERDSFFYVVRFYKDAAYIGSKKGLGGGPNTNGNGLLYRKERGTKPLLVQTFGDGIRGAVATRDFGIRGFTSDGITLWVGAPSRKENFSSVVGIPCVYRYEIDEEGLESVSPNSSIDVSPGNIADKVYSAATIGGEILITTSTGTWKRSKTKKAAIGDLDTSIYDLRAPDHDKTWRFKEIILEDATSTEKASVFYRTGTFTGAFIGGTQVSSSGAKKIAFPDDNPAQSKYKLTSRQLQGRIRLERGADDTKTPRVTSFAVDAAQIRPVGG